MSSPSRSFDSFSTTSARSIVARGMMNETTRTRPTVGPARLRKALDAYCGTGYGAAYTNGPSPVSAPPGREPISRDTIALERAVWRERRPDE